MVPGPGQAFPTAVCLSPSPQHTHTPRCENNTGNVSQLHVNACGYSATRWQNAGNAARCRGGKRPSAVTGPRRLPSLLESGGVCAHTQTTQTHALMLFPGTQPVALPCTSEAWTDLSRSRL